MSLENQQKNDQSLWLDVEDETFFLDPSKAQWQKPYDILIKEAIYKTQEQKKCGSDRKTMLKYILCRYPNLKYTKTKKGLGKAVRRMVASGHIKQSVPGMYVVTKKGQSLKWQYGTRFDRTICGQKKLCEEAQMRRKRNSCKKVKRRSKVKSWKKVKRTVKRNKCATYGRVPVKKRKSPVKKC